MSHMNPRRIPARRGSSLRALVAALIWLPAAAAARPDPLDPEAPVPPLTHASALTAAPSLSETPVGSWREANDTVNRIGGWRAYAREAKPPESLPPAATGTPAAVAPAKPAAGHGHH
jgi:hypothetical protein